LRPSLAGRLRLLRLPLAGTTVADIWAGFFGAQAWLATGPPAAPPPEGWLARLFFLHAASLALYGAGMTLNDVFDAGRDRDLYPDRPIPSGQIDRRRAATQGAGLLALGIAAAFAAGPAHGVIGTALAGAILAYDGALKRRRLLGALAMGCCRALDVQLGAGLAVGAFFPPALALGAYSTLVTAFSTLEERKGLDRARIERTTRLFLLGIFLVDAGSLAWLGRPRLAATTAALVATFPLLARVQRTLGVLPPPRQRA